MERRPVTPLWLAFAWVVALSSCYREQVVYNPPIDETYHLPSPLVIEGKHCLLNATDFTLRCPLTWDRSEPLDAFIEHADDAVVWWNGEPLVNRSSNDLGIVDYRQTQEVVIQAFDQSDTFQLTFTNLPLVHMVTPNRVFDEPKTMAKIWVQHPEPEKPREEHWVGVEHRGHTALRFDKKSFGLGLKGSLNLDDDQSDSILGLPSSHKWILDAAWVDPSRIRNALSFDLWRTIHGKDYLSLQGRHVELFWNDERRGLYRLNHAITAETIGLNGEEDVLYKAENWAEPSTKFLEFSGDLPQGERWEGWRHVHPDPSTRLHWEPLMALRQWAVHSSDESFSSTVHQWVDLDNLVDFFLFVNVVEGLDNTGKNMFWTRGEFLEAFHIVPWDLDATWGLFHDGTSTNGVTIVTNGLFQRLITTNAGQFRDRLRNRWQELRITSCSKETMAAMVSEHVQRLTQSDVVNLENQTWGTNLNLLEEQDVINQWIDVRLQRMDEFIDNL